MKKWVKYHADVYPKIGIIRIWKTVYEAKNPRFHRKNVVKTIEKEMPIIIDIPLEEYEVSVGHFDSTAWQNDDRFYSTTVKRKRYSLELVAQEIERAMIEYNKNPVEIVECL